MTTYPVIRELFDRSEDAGNPLMPGFFATPEITAMRFHQMAILESVPGIQMSVLITDKGMFTANPDVPDAVTERLDEIFTIEVIEEAMKSTNHKSMELFGVVCGGLATENPYFEQETFVAFDLAVNGQFQMFQVAYEIFHKLEIPTFPVVTTGNVSSMVKLIMAGFKSLFGDFEGSGLIARPEVDLYTKAGERIITRLEVSSFEAESVRAATEEWLGVPPMISFSSGVPPREVCRLSFEEDPETNDQRLTFSGELDEGAKAFFDHIVNVYVGKEASKVTAIKAMRVIEEWISGPTPDHARNRSWYANLTEILASTLAGESYESWIENIAHWDMLEAASSEIVASSETITRIKEH